MLHTCTHVSKAGPKPSRQRKRLGQGRFEQLRISLSRVFGSGLLMILLQRRSPTRPFVVAAIGLETKTDTEALDRRITFVLELFEKVDPIKAESELRDMARLHPSYAPASFLMGLVSQRRDEPETAVDFYAAALRADPMHTDATNNIGTALTALPPTDRVRVSEAVGLLPAASKKKSEARAQDGTTGSPADPNTDTDAVDDMIEGLFRRTIQLEPTHRWALNNLGLHLHGRKRDEEAITFFTRALRVYPGDAEISYNKGVAQQALGMAQEATNSFAAVLETHPQHVGAALNLAALHHRYGDIGDAILQYKRAGEIIDPADTDMVIMLRNNLGTALFQIGEHTLAKVEHRAVLALLGGADRNTFGALERAGENSDTYVDTLVNLHRARKASCDWNGWDTHVEHLKNKVDRLQLGFGRPPSVLPFDSLLLPFPVTPSWRRRIAEAHSIRYSSSSATPIAPDELIIDEIRTVDSPFEEQTDDPAEIEKGLSAAHSDGGEAAVKMAEERRRRCTGSKWRRPPLNIGFIGHDFSEHPTAHMMEGVFVWHTRLADAGRKRTGVAEALEPVKGCSAEGWRARGSTRPMAAANCCRYSVYSYGGGGRGAVRVGEDSNSTSSRTRESIRSHAHSFVDLYATGHGESVERIRADGVDILVDLQGHTLGGRSEITAARPARLQVNYLVFPGTSGASYMDYLLADRHVTPPEHARDYSESLVLLPRTYQANMYDDLLPAKATSTFPISENDRAARRREQGLPEDPSRAVFVNFNKIDKLDPESFSLWMQILRRVPGSVLWLLEARAVDTEREAIRGRLRQEAESQGVDGLRIVWAEWVSKSEHLLRHAVADLFLDTLTYGAHSTATDALAGGLPFLTLAGASFASRVGVSLVQNAGPAQSLLLVAAQREYEDVAVELVSTPRGRKSLKGIRASLRQGRTRYTHRSGLENTDKAACGGLHGVGAGVGYNTLAIFDTEAITTDLDRAFMLMSDVHGEWNDRGEGAGRKDNARLPHIVMTGKKIDYGRR